LINGEAEGAVALILLAVFTCSPLVHIRLWVNKSVHNK
jgi:hypothetical protein